MVSGARSVGILQGMDLLRRSSCVASAALLLLCAAPARSQDSASTRTGRAAVERCVEAMGGRARLREVRSAAIEIQAKASIKERHTLLLPSRALHYASRREGGAGFDVVVKGDKGFLCDRDPEGKTSYVEDLTEADLLEGAYERDVLFMPLLLEQLLADPRTRYDSRGPNSVGDVVVRVLAHPANGAVGEPFVIRLRFDKTSHLLVQSMGLVPCGADEGKKRFFSYGDYRAVGELKLPSSYSDERGKGTKPRAYRVTWSLNPKLSPTFMIS